MITGLIIGFVAGLVVGWNFLAQPAAVKVWVDKIRGKDPVA